MKTTLISFLVCISAELSVAQIPLDLIMIIPLSPTTSDFIKVVKPVPTNYGTLISSASWNNGSSHVIVNPCYFIGIAASTLTHYDTIDIGYLPSGQYELDYNAAFSWSSTTCNFDWTIFHETSFQVIDDLSINEEHLSQYGVLPYPSNGEIQIIGLEENELAHIEILNLNGRQITNLEISTVLFLDVPSGTYLLRVTSRNGYSFIKRIIKY